MSEDTFIKIIFIFLSLGIISIVIWKDWKYNFKKRGGKK